MSGLVPLVQDRGTNVRPDFKSNKSHFSAVYPKFSNPAFSSEETMKLQNSAQLLFFLFPYPNNHSTSFWGKKPFTNIKSEQKLW
uniref:Uncharacterized protein n=1 Tax=Solanum lycopersicum TaxID=4081 RepID=A0A3Q7G224_SOLLC